MTQTGAWHCEWPACERLATTQLRTSNLPWMKVCATHRTVWTNCTIELLEHAYRNRQPPRRTAGSPSRRAPITATPWTPPLRRPDHHRQRRR